MTAFRRLQKCFIYQLIFGLLFFCAAATVSATERIQDFESVIEVQADGTLLVTEVITYDFGSLDRRGIFRDLSVKHAQPANSWFYDREVAYELLSVVRNGVAEEVEVIQGSNVRFKIGNPDRMISGVHTYKIQYQVIGAISTFSDNSYELYWNVTGDDWPVTIDTMTTRLLVGDGVTFGDEAACYQGIKNSQGECAISTNDAGEVVFTAERLSPGQQVTIAQSIELPVAPVKIETFNFLSIPIIILVVIMVYGIFNPTKFQWLLFLLYASIIILLLLAYIYAGEVDLILTEHALLYAALGALVLIGYSIVWYRWVTAARPHIPRKVQYEPYEGVLPMYSGVLIDKSLNGRDVTAGFLHLAQSGFITIKEVESKSMFGFIKKDYVITLIKSPTEVVSEFHTELLKLLFAGNLNKKFRPVALAHIPFILSHDPVLQGSFAPVGTTITLQDIKNNDEQIAANTKVIKRLKKAIKNDLIAKGFIKESPLLKKQGVARLAVYVGLLLTVMLLYTGPLLPLGILLLVLPFLFSRRTKKGYEAKQYLEGFKQYLCVTGRRRFKFHNAPSKNPEQFLKYLPYAVAFGVEREWAEVFKGIDFEAPNWYQSANQTHFNPAIFTQQFGAFNSVATSATVLVVSSGSGSVGGGGGGGGGGSW